MNKKLALTWLLPQLKSQVDKRLTRHFARGESRAARIGPEVLALASAVKNLCMRGGKRLRPLFLHAGAICQDPKFPLTLSADAGVALELLQAYFLIHDDWMDEDAERRGGPTAHIELTEALGSTHLGERAAILAGDLAVALAQETLANLGAAPDRLVLAMGIFARMQRDAVFGQQLDIVAQNPKAELTYLLKTASYTVEGPLRMGVVLAGGSPEAEKALTRYAEPAGIAFQLRDDLLGLFGDPTRTGKPHGADLLSGKRTAFINLAEAHLPPEGQRSLKAVFGRRQASQAKVRALLRILERSEARTMVEARIATLEKKALAALQSRALTVAGRELLTEATTALLYRDS